MGALFILFALLAAIAVIYPAFVAVLWLISRHNGNRETFREFLDL
jgi:hypothetical protein